jgi:hypothetical protein
MTIPADPERSHEEASESSSSEASAHQEKMARVHLALSSLVAAAACVDLALLMFSGFAKNYDPRRAMHVYGMILVGPPMGLAFTVIAVNLWRWLFGRVVTPLAGAVRGPRGHAAFLIVQLVALGLLAWLPVQRLLG